MKKDPLLGEILKRLEKLEKKETKSKELNPEKPIIDIIKEEGERMLSYKCLNEFIAASLKKDPSAYPAFSNRLESLQECCNDEETRSAAFTMNYLLEHEPAFRMAMISIYFYILSEFKEWRKDSKDHEKRI